MRQTSAVETAILENVERRGAYTLEELAQDLPTYTRNQIFSAVDQLSRETQLTLRRLSRLDDYLITTSSAESHESSAQKTQDAMAGSTQEHVSVSRQHGKQRPLTTTAWESIPPEIIGLSRQMDDTGTALCVRCNGLMCPAELRDSHSSGPDSFEAFRCISCGEIVDPVILHNRLRRRVKQKRMSSTRHGRRRQPRQYTAPVKEETL